jgi:hypothetical protein
MGHSQITDAYLLALAVNKAGTLATFDHWVAIGSVVGALPKHVRLLCPHRILSVVSLLSPTLGHRGIFRACSHPRQASRSRALSRLDAPLHGEVVRKGEKKREEHAEIRATNRLTS